MGVSKALISNMCKGRRNLSDETLGKCRKALNMDELKYLIIGTEPKIKPAFPNSISNDYTRDEEEIIKHLRSLPDFKETILTSLRFKVRQKKKDYVDYINR